MKNHRWLLLTLSLALLLKVSHSIAIVNHLYWKSWWFDTAMHFLGGIIIGAFFIWVVQRFGLELSKPSFFLLLLSFTLIIGVAWELFEFYNGITYRVFSSYIFDVFKDVIADLSGAISLAIVALFGILRKPDFNVNY